MSNEYWFRQNDKPLFPDLEWSRPENKHHAGKLLIVGGNQFGFVQPAEAFRYATEAGIGTARMFLPDSLTRFVGKTFTAGELAPSTPSGSFAAMALAPLLAATEWSDAVLLAGGIGSNSETVVMLENFASKYTGRLILSDDAVDHISDALQNRADTLFVLSFVQLQKYFQTAHSPVPITSKMDLLTLVEALHQITLGKPSYVLTTHNEYIFVAMNGQVSTTKATSSQTKLVAYTSVWWLQNPTKPFEALTVAAHIAGK